MQHSVIKYYRVGAVRNSTNFCNANNNGNSNYNNASNVNNVRPRSLSACQPDLPEQGGVPIHPFTITCWVKNHRGSRIRLIDQFIRSLSNKGVNVDV